MTIYRYNGKLRRLTSGCIGCCDGDCDCCVTGSLPSEVTVKPGVNNYTTFGGRPPGPMPDLVVKRCDQLGLSSCAYSATYLRCEDCPVSLVAAGGGGGPSIVCPVGSISPGCTYEDLDDGSRWPCSLIDFLGPCAAQGITIATYFCIDCSGVDAFLRFAYGSIAENAGDVNWVDWVQEDINLGPSATLDCSLIFPITFTGNWAFGNSFGVSYGLVQDFTIE